MSGTGASGKSPASEPSYKLELYPTERRYSVANFDRNCSLDFSGQRSLRLALQEGHEEDEEESEEVRKQLAEQQARPKRSARASARRSRRSGWCPTARRRTRAP